MCEHIQEISENKNINVCFQYLLPGHAGYTLNCRAVKKSIGILPDGTVTGCFWYLDDYMKPNDDFILGRLPNENIMDILTNVKNSDFFNKCKKCKLFTKDNEY